MFSTQSQTRRSVSASGLLRLAATIVAIQVMVITLVFGFILPLWAVLPAAFLLVGEVCIGILTMLATACVPHR